MSRRPKDIGTSAETAARRFLVDVGLWERNGSGYVIHCVDEDGSVCWSVGPHGARCDIRRGHIGAHGGIDQTGTWRQWT